MAKKSPAVGGGLLSALVAPQAKKKKDSATEKKRAKIGEDKKAGRQQTGELQSDRAPPMPSHKEMTNDEARWAKRNATRQWIEGKLSNKQHAGIHERANRVLTNRVPKVALPKGW